MDDTDNLQLPYLMPSQAQKHVTHNEALRLLDALVHLAVVDRDLSAPPTSPADGERHIVATAASGVWTGRKGQVASWQDAAEAIDVLQNLSRLGIGTTADGTNPFAAKLNTALFGPRCRSPRAATATCATRLNKEGAGDVLSLLMQSGFSGRAELGLIGDDDWTLKVSPDGATWKTALAVDRATGAARFLAGSATVASAATCDIGAAPALAVTINGTAAISSFGAVANALRLVTFDGALTLVHNATSLFLPTGAAIVTATGDTALVTADGAGNWRVRAYQRANGKALTAAVSDLCREDPSGRRRNVFLNPFFDVAQAYAGAFAFGPGGVATFPSTWCGRRARPAAARCRARCSPSPPARPTCRAIPTAI